MAFIFDETWVNNGQLIVAEAGVNPKALGEGIDKSNTLHMLKGHYRSVIRRTSRLLKAL